MKRSKKYIGSIAGLLCLLFMSVIISCDDEEKPGTWQTGDIQTLIDEAQSLLANEKEGTQPGEYKPGALKELQNVTNWAVWKLDNSESQSEIELAAKRLSTYIEQFKGNLVELANPWVQQQAKTFIKVLDYTEGGGTDGNLKKHTKNNFTVEGWFYIMNLQQRGWSNNLFANAMGKGGENDRGFGVRYFADGHAEFIVGGGDGWKQANTSEGVLKAGEWTHVAFVNEITSQSLYVNGVQVASQTETYADSDEDFPLTIGNSFAWDDRVMNAMVKDFRFWTEARTEQQIADNKDANLTGEEANLEVFLPFNADLGTEFPDITGKYKASFEKSVEWVIGGIPPEVKLDFATIDNSISKLKKFMDEVSEGTNNGDYPVGTITYIQGLIDDSEELKTTTRYQDELNKRASELLSKITLIQENLVADSDGILINAQNSSHVGLKVTPTYSPAGSFTIEFEVYVNSLLAACCGQGNMLGTGSYGLIYGAYDNPTEQEILNSGTLYFYMRNNGGYGGPRSPAGSISPEKWQHIALVYDASEETAKIFVDNQEVASEDSINVPDAVDWGEMWIGNAWVKMDGQVKDFRFWGEAKSAGELDADITGTEANLEMYFPLNKVAGIKFKDVTGNYSGEMIGVEWKVF